MYNEGLIMIEDKIHEMCNKSLTHFILPASNRNNSNNNMNTLEKMLPKPYDLNKLSEYISENEPKLMNDQLTVYSFVLNNVRFNKKKFFFFIASGKTTRLLLLI